MAGDDLAMKDLARKVTEILLQRLGEEGGQRGPEKSGPLFGPDYFAPIQKKPLLLVAGSCSYLSGATLAELEKSFAIKEFASFGEIPPPEAWAVIPRLNIQALCRAAAGDEGCTLEGRLLLSAFLNGRPVAAIRSQAEWRRYLGSAPSGLLDGYRKMEEKLVSYGLILCEEPELGQALAQRRPGESHAAPGPGQAGKPASRNGPPGAAFRGRRVISERELMALCPESLGPGQILSLSPRDLLTPLAMDYALSRKIAVIRET
jgi:hypothetical protein